MPRNLPLGNGSLLIAFNQNHHLRELFNPHVGQSNHALGHPFRTGVWVMVIFAGWMTAVGNETFFISPIPSLQMSRSPIPIWM